MSTQSNFLAHVGRRTATQPAKATPVTETPHRYSPAMVAALHGTAVAPLTGAIEVPALAPQMSADYLKIYARLWGTRADMVAAGVPEDEIARHFPAAPIASPVPVVVKVEAPVPAVDSAWAMPSVRPRVSNIVHLFNEDGPGAHGTCATAWVVEVLNGAPSAGVEVTATDPYLKVTALGGRKPIYARFEAAPVKRLTPGFRPPIASWHRVSECPRSH